MKFNKTLLVFLGLALCISYNSKGKTIDANTAKIVGYNYLLEKVGPQILTSIDALKLEYTSKNAQGVNCFYVFNAPTGFVMVSSDDAVQPILAYSTDRQFHGNRIPPNVLYFISGYSSQINDAITNHLSATPENSEKWYNLINNVQVKTVAKTTAVTPLLSTSWDQSPYYNDSCPYDATHSGLSVTGCVATATAQVMKYWNWPTTGVGSHSYTTTTMGFTCSANFGAATYNWSLMPNSVTAHNNEVAKLMYHVGVAVDMDYSNSSSGSGAYVISSSTSTPPYCAEYALKNIFRYASTLQGLARSPYTDATWISMLQTDLNAGRPIVYAGFGSAGGHCWVVDGYDASNNMHCNWGWSGAGPDGYYSINAMNPPILGTGGGGGGFNSGQQAIFGIKPNISPITGTLSVCAGSTTTLADATAGGTWSSATTSVATVSTAGVVTGVSAGTSVISYTVSGNTIAATVTVNPAPNAGTISGGPASICLGSTRTLTDGVSGGTWSSSASSIASVSAGIVTGVTGGVATISYTVTNSCGTASTSTTITVNSAPAITTAPVVTSPGTTPCVGTSATYTASCTGAASFVWTVSGTGWSGTSTSGTLVAGVGSGTGTIVVSGTNSCGTGPTTTVSIVPNNIPSVPAVTMSGTLPCTGATTSTFNAVSSGATSYIWSILGSGWSGSSTTSAITLTLGSGTGTLICTATNACGNSGSDSTAVSSSPLPSAPIVTLTSAAPCIGATSASYDAVSSGAISYNWTVTGTGWSGSSTTGTLTVAIGSGTGTIVCSAVNACGAGSATTVNLTPASSLGAASEIMATTSICSGNTATFITPTIAGATSYLWTIIGTGWIGSSTTSMLTVTVGTSPATISVAGVNACGSGSPYVLSSVSPIFVPNSSFSLTSHALAVGATDLVTYTGTASSYATYSWNFSGGTATPGYGVGPHTIHWATPGLKTVSLSVTDSGCTSVVFTDTVIVGSTTEFPNMPANTYFQILPNPNNGAFEILFNNVVNNPIVIRITDIQGRIVFTDEQNNSLNNKLSVDVTTLPNGIYTGTVITNGYVQNFKVVISK